MKLKQKKGISLVVLVIVVIVMAILATVIILSVEDSDMIDKTSGTIYKTNLRNLKEEIKTKLTQSSLKTRNLSASALENALKQIPGASIEKIAEDAWIVGKQEAYITVYKTGELIEGILDVWDGTSKAPEIKKGDWYIYTCEELKFLADYVNNGNALTSAQKTQIAEAGYNEADYVIETTTTVYLMNNLDLGARQSNGILTSGTAWTPIGNLTNTFNGIFEGNNHFIAGMYMVRSEKCIGIFGKSTNTISNLTVRDGYAEVTEISPGGAVASVVNKIYNCHNSNTKIVRSSASNNGFGGVTGQAAIAENCTNTGRVIADGYNVAGVVGIIVNNGKIENCQNRGDITCYKEDSAGIVGVIMTGTSMNNCINYASVTGDGLYVAGICGIAQEATNINNCINYGTILGKTKFIGGISGGFLGYDLEKCYNFGDIKANGDGVFGVAGICGVYAGENMINTYNRGNILVEGDNVRLIGGITGYSSKSGMDTNNTKVYNTISNNYNIGKITIKGSGATEVGGVIGGVMNSTFTMKNNYYLSKTTTIQSNTEGESKTEAEMKTATFVTLLNTGLSTSVWEIRSAENDGYPVLIGLNTINK